MIQWIEYVWNSWILFSRSCTFWDFWLIVTLTAVQKEVIWPVLTWIHFFSLARFSKVCGFQRKIQFCTEFFCSSVSNTFYILFKPLYPCSTGCNQQCIGYIIYIWYKPLYPCSTGCNQQCIGYFLQNIQRGSARSSASSKGRSQNNP